MTPENPEGLRAALRIIGIFGQAGIEYHLGGSYASSIHGLPRQTQDVDLVADLRLEQIDPLIDALASGFYADRASAQRALRDHSSFNVVHLESGIKVDIFCRGPSAFDREEFARAAPIPLYGIDPATSVRVKTAEDTILRKLQWFRLGGETSDRQWSDAIGCLRVQGDKLDLPYLRRWAGELEVDDLLEQALAESAESSP